MSFYTVQAATVWPNDYSDICGLLKLKRSRVSRGKSRALTVGDVLDFCAWLVKHPDHQGLAGGVALQGLAGLRLKEAWRLTWEGIDLEAGTVQVEDSKNEYSNRNIPVIQPVLWILRQAKNGGGRARTCPNRIAYQ